MPTNNAVNISGSGICKYDGAGTFSAVTVTQHDVLIGGASNGIGSIALTNGQLAIGSTGADPVAATISAGAGISVSPGAGSITISTTGGGMTWSVVAVATGMLVNNGYGSNAGGAVAFTLPAVSAIGDTLAIQGMQGSWNVVQGAGQAIHIGSAVSATGAGGSIASTNAFDAVELVCLVANTIWYCKSVIGNITVA